jgi:hypothetical protein
MSPDLRKLYRAGGAAFVVSGLLFVLRAALDFSAGEPPSNGVEILLWVASHRLTISLISEILFVATVFLVPAGIALHQSLVGVDRVKAAAGAGIMAVVIPVLVVLLIVHGRLVYPVYGLSASTPDQAALILGVFYGGMHAVDLLMAAATVILSLAMRGSAYGTLVAHLFFAGWFLAVGARLFTLRDGAIAA